MSIKKALQRALGIGISAMLASVMVFALSGCGDDGKGSVSPEPSKNIVAGVAATGDGYQVTEQEVADYISQYRKYINREDDSAWATLIDESGQTIEEIRENAILYLVEDKVLEQKATELGVSVSDDELEAFVEKAKTETGYSADDKGWTSLLQVSGYTEDSYRKDAHRLLLSQKVFGEEIEYTEPTEAQLQTYANENAESYVGKKAVGVVFPHKNGYEANNFAKQFDKETVTSETFKDAGQMLVDKGAAIKVANLNWSCLIDTTSAYDSAIDTSVPGDIVVLEDNDGTYMAVLITDAYILPYNGRIALSEVPDEIMSRLVADTTLALHRDQETQYMRELLEKTHFEIADMPEDAPYNVDLSKSTYGSETTTNQSQDVTDALINSQIAQLEATAKTASK